MGVVRVLAIVVGACALAPAAGAATPAYFGARSYAPGQTAYLHIATSAHLTLQVSLSERSYAPGQRLHVRIESDGLRILSLRLFAVGAEAAPFSRSAGHDDVITGVPRTAARRVHLRASTQTIAIRVRDWASGVYAVRARARGLTRYAVFVLRAKRLGESRVLVVEPTNTWQAYNFEAGDSWYLNPEIHTVALDRPYLGDGLPPYFRDYDLGFLRWYWRTGHEADFVSDDDIERVHSAAALRREYRLIVFPGHEEYVTPAVYALIRSYRDLGGNLAFLSADSFFYRADVSGDTMVGRTRWRDLGLPEAALVGAEYVGWDERRYPNRPFRIVDRRAAPWLFAGTGLRDGSRFGRYGIEVDETVSASPREVRVIATIPSIFGPGVGADMTVYRRGQAEVFDAGAMNFGASADWPVVSRLVSNLWRHLTAAPG